jgi:excisionase family DNA binding protein
MGQLLTVDEVAAQLKKHRNTVYQLIRDGEMPCVDVSRKGGRATLRVREEDLREWLAARHRPATGQRAA